MKNTIEPKTNVMFRQFADGDIIALFVSMAADRNPENCQSYMHIGQHSAAHPLGVIATTKPATKAQYSDLKKELENIGYDLRVIKHYDAFKCLESREKQISKP
jgi:hypothetical protein